MATERKLEEANECIKQAEKSLKTSFLKWKPDYDEASTQYTRAATCYKAIRQWEQSRECLLKAAENFLLNESHFSAGKSYEQAGLMSKELNEMDKVVLFIDKAANLFRQHGVPDTAALCLEKGGKIVEEKLPEKAIDLFLKAADVVMLEDRPRQAAEYTSKAARLMVKLKRYDQAVDTIRQEVDYYMQAENTKALGRLYIVLIILHLVRDDSVAATKAYKEGTGYMEMEEISTMSQLLDAYDECDHKLLYEALSHPFIKHMDTEYAKLARTLQHINPEALAMGVGIASSSSTPVHQSQESSQPAINITSIPAVMGNAEIPASEEDYEGGLL